MRLIDGDDIDDENDAVFTFTILNPSGVEPKLFPELWQTRAADVPRGISILRLN